MHPRLELSTSIGPARNTALTLWAGDMDALERLLSPPQPGAKDGSYLVRGPFHETPTRSDEHITRATIVVLDGDKRLDPQSGELFDGAPAPEIVHEALIDAGVNHLLFTSYSHQDPRRGGANFHRWRCVVPAELKDAEELRAVVDHLLHLLHARSVMLAPSRENYVWSQAWFLPRLRSPDAPFRLLRYDEGESLNVAAIVAAYRARSAAETPTQPVTLRRAESGTDSPIGRFLAVHGEPGSIINRLEAHGYVLRHTTTLNGECAYRLIRPGSTSGIPGVTVFRHRQGGKWLVCSHHGADDPLAGPDGLAVVHDAFSVFCCLEHGGNARAALAAIRSALPEPPAWRFDAPPPEDESPPSGRQEDVEAASTAARNPQPAPADARAEIISAADLVKLKFEPLRWVVPALLPEGVTLLVGSPKIGKSWLSLELILSVACGTPVLGRAEVEPGSALYLALEDNRRRLQRRVLSLMREGAPTTAHLVTAWPRIDQGGAENLAWWLEQYTDCRLIVIDTLAKFRPPSNAKKGLYEQDYTAVAPLIPLATKHRCAIVVVHHTRKGEADDPMELISGTQGLAGGVDNILILKRNRFTKQGELHVTGRDIEDEQVYALDKSDDNRWIIKSSGQEALLHPARLEILNIVRAHGPIRGQDIAALIHPGARINRASKEWRLIRYHLAALEDQGLITKGTGGYVLAGL